MSGTQGNDAYKAAGVDIEAGNQFVEQIAGLAASTSRPGVLGGLGGFGGMFALPPDLPADPVLVSGTDGVGTKLLVAQKAGNHSGIGIDLVAMCANDIIAQGAEPLFFLDYYATGKLEPHVGKEVLEGIAEGCRQAGCALLGGETAEMPGVYPEGGYDLAGFCVGIVGRANILGPDRTRAGLSVIALGSSGFHSNGYSLLRRVLLEDAGLGLGDELPGGTGTVGEVLLRPTRIYARAVQETMEKHGLLAAAHITGGGLIENPPRAYTEDLALHVEAGAQQLPPDFTAVQALGALSDSDMLRTFNCGVGMLLFLPPEEADAALVTLAGLGERAWLYGRLVDKQAGMDAVVWGE